MFTVNSTQYPAGKAWVQYCQIAAFATWRLWNDSLNQNALLSWQQEQSMGREKGFKTKAGLYTSFLSKSSLSTECLTYPSWAFGGTDWSQSSEPALLVMASSVSDHFLLQSFMCTLGITGSLAMVELYCLNTWDPLPELPEQVKRKCNVWPSREVAAAV